MRKISLEQLSWNLILLICLIYLWTVLKYSVNMPLWDDYDAVLRFLNTYIESNESLVKIKLIFFQHNEHRIVFNRIIELLQFKLMGEINFLYLIIIGNIGWFLTIAFLWRYAKKREIKIVQFLPVVLIMLSFVHYELMTWAMASLQQYYQILFSLFAIYFLVNNRLIFSFLFMTVSIFTSGGGIVLIPIFLLYFLTQRDVKNFFITLIVSIILLLIYFIILHYSKPKFHPSILKTLFNPLLVVHYALTFIGNIGKTKLVSLIVGISMLTLFTIIGKKVYNQEPFLFWSTLFIIATALVTALARAGFGIKQSLSSKYSVYSVLLLSLIYLSYLITFKNKKIYLLGLVVGIVSFSFWFIYGTPWLEIRANALKKEILYPNAEDAENILKKSAQLKVFTSWQGIKLPSSLLNLPKIEGNNVYCIAIAKQIRVCNGSVRKYYSPERSELKISIDKTKKKLRLEGWTVDSLNGKQACGVVTQIDGKKQFFTLLPRRDVARSLNNQNYLWSGIVGDIDISDLKPGEYILEIRTIDNTCSGYYETLKVPVLITDITQKR